MEHLEAGDHEGAVREFDESIKLLGDMHPQVANAYGNRGRAHLKACDYDKAIADCTTAIALFGPFNFKAALHYATRSEAFRNKGEYEMASGDCTMALTGLPADDPNRGMVYESRGVARI